MPRAITPSVTLHAPSGQYRKRIGGRDYYLGTDHKVAVERLLAMLDKRRAKGGDFADGSIRLAALAGLYEAACLKEVDAGRMIRATFTNYDSAITEFLLIVGESREVRDLQPDDFAKVRQQWAQRFGSPHSVNRSILAVRRLFNWAKETDTIVNLPKYGLAFKSVPKREVRDHRIAVTERRGERKFTADELRNLIGHADCIGLLRTCILLALNTGFYAVDCGDLTWGEVVTRDKIRCIDRKRRKTSVRQRAPLWPEVAAGIDALRRPGAKPTDLVFTQAGGQPISVRDSNHDWLSKQFDALQKASGTKRAGVSFGSLKHTHTSAVGDHPDELARTYVRGHVAKDEDVTGVYDIPETKRLKAVTDLAYARLYLHSVNPRRRTKRPPQP